MWLEATGLDSTNLEDVILLPYTETTTRPKRRLPSPIFHI